MTYETILVDKQDGIATVTLNRPARLNAWVPRMGAELTAAFRDIDADRSVRVAVLTGAGRAFCAGADMDVLRRAGGGRRGHRDGGGAAAAGAVAGRGVPDADAAHDRNR